MKRIGYVMIFTLVFSAGHAQELAPLVKAKVNQDQVMFEKMLWRRMDLKEKQNSPFFSQNGELSKLLIEAVDEGLITPYRSDSCLNFMPDDIFASNMSVEREEGSLSGDGFSDSGFDTFDSGQNGEGNGVDDEPKLERIPGDLFSVAYIRERLIFDRNRSRMYYYIQSLSLALPGDAGADWNPAGFEKLVVHFKYEDVIDLFRGAYADRSIYYNTQNNGAHLNMSDAFELRLFNAPIIKMSNPQDLDIRQQYADEIARDPMNAILIQQKYEYDLMEYESELWEY